MAEPAPDPGFESTRRRLRARIAKAAHDVLAGDEAEIARAVEGLARSHRALAPLAFGVGGVLLLLGGVRLLLANWRLTLIQLLPAIWVWLAMYDLRAHLLHGDSVRILTGPVLVPAILVIVAITVLAFFLNAVFGFAISQPGRPEIRPAVAEARRRLRPIAASGALLGLALALATTVVSRAGAPWFAICLSAVVGLMMVAYVAVPSRLIGAAPIASRRDRLSAGALGAVLGVAVCTPPYLLGRIGLLMIGSPVLRLPGLVLLVVGATLQAGATSAVRALKLGAKLGAAGRG